MLDRVKTEQVVDVFQAVKTLRIQRTGLVENVVCMYMYMCCTYCAVLYTCTCTCMCMAESVNLMHATCMYVLVP